jgi:hypothetical protein
MMSDPGVGRHRRAVALGVCLLTLLVAGFSFTARRPLGSLGGLSDEWHVLGANLAVHGTLGVESEPWVFRPPGYPAFIAAVLRLAGPPAAVSMSYLIRAEGAVYAAQSLALAAAAVALFLWLSTWLRPTLAAAAAVVFAVNPLSILSVGLLNYTVLHLLGLVLGIAALDRVAASPARSAAVIATGALWGLVTLVRPITLPLPVFAFLVFRFRRPVTWPRAARATALLTLGMALVITPWTARNYHVSGRWVPVNLQSGFALWAATVKPLPWDPNHYAWFELHPERSAVHTRVTGEERYELATFVRFLPELEAEHRAEALRNLRRQPLVYVRNVARGLSLFAAGTPASLVRAFAYRQTIHGYPTQEWFLRGSPVPLGHVALGRGVEVLFAALLLLSVLGLAAGPTAGRRVLMAPVLVAACVALAHALTQMDLMYLYLRLPFLAVFAFAGADRLSSFSRGPTGPERTGNALALGLAGSAVALTLWMLRAAPPLAEGVP